MAPAAPEDKRSGATARQDAPSVTDPLLSRLSQRLGGPAGRHAGNGGSWWNPIRVALLVGSVVYLAGMAFRLPCRITVAGQSIDQYGDMCYSDIPLLFSGRGLLQGNIPYLDSGDYPVLEYPVLTGWFLELERRITLLLGAPSGSGLTDQQAVDATLTFLDVNQVVLGALFLVTVWAQARTVPGRAWDAMLVAASPCVATAALVNWDLLPVALTATALLAWSRRRPGLAGLLLGLGMAAKLYPAFLLGPLLLLCLRGRRMPAFGTALASFALGWLVVNLPALLLAPQAWLSFWRFNSERSGDFGSIWYVFSLAGFPVPHLNLVSAGLFALACLAVGLLILLAPARPRLGSVAFLVVAAFLMTNKVYSPQYVLWLLPLVALARPRWRPFLVWQAAEALVLVTRYYYFAGAGAVGASGLSLGWFVGAVALRDVTLAVLAGFVVRDILQPERDDVRLDDPDGDDPAGGLLRDAPDGVSRPHRRETVDVGA